MSPDHEVISLGQLACAEPRWVWAYCVKIGCGHYRAVPVIPFLIRWGPNVSSNHLRRNLTCSKCGTRGVDIRLPSQIGSHGSQMFPVDKALNH